MFGKRMIRVIPRHQGAYRRNLARRYAGEMLPPVAPPEADEGTMATLYLPYSHDEDAEPIVRKGKFMIVSDGFGGSGASIHRLGASTEDLEAKITSSALAGFEGPSARELEGESRRLIASFLKHAEATSAYFASRIVALRLAYFYLAHEEERIDDSFLQGAYRFVRDGLRRFAEAFDLAKDVDFGVLLPATLVSLVYRQDEIHVVYAGDSRAFLFSPSGLFYLSRDNESQGGAVTHYFSAEDDDSRSGKVTDNVFSLAALGKAPHAIIVASDGAFDPFSPVEAQRFGLSYVLGKTLLKSSSLASWTANIKGMYLDKENGYQQDDLTMAVAVEDFPAFKKAMVPLCEGTTAAWPRFLKTSRLLRAREGYEGALEQMRKRARARFGRLVELIAKVYLEKGSDPVLEGGLRLFIDGAFQGENDISMGDLQAFLNENPEQTIECCLNGLAREGKSSVVASLFSNPYFAAFLSGAPNLEGVDPEAFQASRQAYEEEAFAFLPAPDEL